MNRFLLFISFLFVSLHLLAIPAKPVKRTLQLADGTQVETTLRGDEDFHFYAADDGRNFVHRNGTFIPVDQKEISESWASQKKMSPRRGMSSKKRLPSINPSFCSGNKKGLVVLINFDDVKFTVSDPLALYKDFFNKKGYTDYGMHGSVHDYFYDQSYGKLNYTFDVVGPVQVSQPQAFYGQDDNENKRKDINWTQMVEEACKLIDAQVNFKDYDGDGDGEVDQVFFIYAGYSQAEGAQENTLWPKEGSGYQFYEADGVLINTAAIANELRGVSGTKIGGIGTACHEFSHCLGIPDMYDTDYSGGWGMDNWDLMNAGSYLDNGCTPCGYTSFERMYVGWMQPIEVSDGSDISNMPALTDQPVAYIMYNDGFKDEYYLLENRQQTSWDKSLYGHGMLVLHVDYNASAWQSNSVNDNPDHERCTIIPADGVRQSSYRSLQGDPWPGITGNTALTTQGTPAATVFNPNTDGSYFMNKNIVNIAENNGLISFKVFNNMETPVLDSVKSVKVDNSSIKLEWNAVKDAKGYELSVTEIPVASHNLSECLMYSEDFSKCYAKTAGFSDISSKLSNYISSGWSGSKLYCTPNYLRIGTSTVNGSLSSPYYEAPESGEVTIVYDATLYKAGTPVQGGIVINESTDRKYVTSSANYSFELTSDGLILLHLTNLVGIFNATIEPLSPMYVKNFTIYEGEWTAEELKAAGSKHNVQRRRISQQTYPFQDNFCTLSNLKDNCKYEIKVRAVGEYFPSGWSNMLKFDMTKKSGTQLGDVNGDNLINVGDITALVSLIMSNYSTKDDKFKAADMNSDGVLNVGDLTKLIELIMQGN